MSMAQHINSGLMTVKKYNSNHSLH